MGHDIAARELSMALNLQKVNRGPHLPTLVASSITREIAQGRLKPGDQLPTEQTLAETFGVSRSVVREAIARLKFEGRVWTRQGRGAFVSAAKQPLFLQIEHDEEKPRDVFVSLFEFRRILEGQSVIIAAQQRTDQDIADIRATIETMAAAPYGSIAWLNGDISFHQAIARATRNVYIVRVLSFVAEQMRESILAAGGESHSDEMAKATEGEHRRILAAIEAQDADKAQKEMIDHLAGAAERVNARSRASAVETAGQKPSARRPARPRKQMQDL